MQTYQGIGCVEGVAIEKILKLTSSFASYERRHISSEEEINNEIEKLNSALYKLEKEAQEQLNNKNLPEEAYSIIDTHLMLMKDKKLVPVAIDIIKKELINAEWALIRLNYDLEKKFEQIQDDYIRNRYIDIRQIVRDLMKYMQVDNELHLERLENSVILFCDDLSPSNAFKILDGKILGIVIEGGSKNSHATILCSSLGIPLVTGVKGIIDKIKDDELAFINGKSGAVIYQPDEEKIYQIQLLINQRKAEQLSLEQYKNKSTELKDGTNIKVLANLDIMQEIDLIKNLNVEGIGMIRTEFLFLNYDEQPSEEQQFQVYNKIVQGVQGQVCFRTWDIGSDKIVNFIEELIDPNKDTTHLRAISLCMQHPQFFKQQVRALIRIAQQKPIRVMIPMIMNLEELYFVQDMFDQEAKNLALELDNVSLGAMIETPAASFIIQEVTEICEFISIGTNDLMQYTLAYDRSQEHEDRLISLFHPALLRIIAKIISTANRERVAVSICGESATNPIMQLFLLGTGNVELSMNPQKILKTKKFLSQFDHKTCKKIAFRLNSNNTTEENLHYIKKLYLYHAKELQAASM